MSAWVMYIKLYAPWVHSLKEKRMIVRSLTAKVRNKFNVSVVEAMEQDKHQIIVIGIAALAAHAAQAYSMQDTIIHYMEQNTEAEIIEINKEIY